MYNTYNLWKYACKYALIHIILEEELLFLLLSTNLFQILHEEYFIPKDSHKIVYAF